MSARRPARILYCEQNTDGTVGGSYYSLLYLLQGLDRSRYEPTVVFYTEHSLLPAFREAGVETLVWPRPRPFGFARRGPSWLRPLLQLLQKALNVGTLFVVPAVARARFLRARDVSLVHLNNSVITNHDWMLAALMTGRPCVTHERGINERYPALARYFARRLAAILCISEAVRQNMRDHGLDFGSLVTIPNGLDPAVLRREVAPTDLRRLHGIEPDAPVVVMTGNIKAWKGQDTLIRALDTLRRSFPAVRCVLVGATSPADRDYERRVTGLVRSLGLESLVVFAGHRANVADYLDMSDVVVHASVLPEPFGRVLLEAMACRRPVVAADAGGVPEIVQDGVTGVLFPPGDHIRLAAAIERLIANREEARRMGEHGYARLVDHFQVSRNVEATQRLYETILREDD